MLAVTVACSNTMRSLLGDHAGYLTYPFGVEKLVSCSALPSTPTLPTPFQTPPRSPAV
jgi:hypothetical protein